MVWKLVGDKMEKIKVIFVHGFGGGRYEYQPLINFLKNYKIKSYEFLYKERFGQVSLKKIAKQLNEFIRKNVKGKFILLGLSQGGIISTYYLEYLNGKKFCEKCIAICTPFYGSNLAYLFSLKGAKELRPKSVFLKKLREKIKKSKVKYYSIWNPLDLAVFPGKNANLEYARKSKKVISILHPKTFWEKETKEFILESIRDTT